MDFTSLDLLEEVMMSEAPNQFYKEVVLKKDHEEQRPRSLSLSITKPDWTSMLNTGEKSLRITDQLLDTPEILSQSLDWQLHGNQQEPDLSQYYLPETVDEKTQITAIKNELQQDYETVASPPAVTTHSPYSYYTDQDHTYVEESSRAGDGSVSPTCSDAPSSMVADDEADEDYSWYPSGRRRPGRPKSSNSGSSKSRPKEKRKLSEVDKDSDEYKAKRKRNNVAVRKSRDKAKRQHVEVQEKNKELEKENAGLKKHNESLVREVSVLRKLITDIGRKIPDNLAFDLGQYST